MILTSKNHINSALKIQKKKKKKKKEGTSSVDSVSNGKKNRIRDLKEIKKKNEFLYCRKKYPNTIYHLSLSLFVQKKFSVEKKMLFNTAHCSVHVQFLRIKVERKITMKLNMCTTFFSFFFLLLFLENKIQNKNKKKKKEKL